MFESVLHNRNVLLKKQERSRRTPSIWPAPCHLRHGDFLVQEHILTVLEPTQEVILALSSNMPWVGEVVPLITAALDEMQRIDV